MADYVYQVTIPAATEEGDPYREKLRLGVGVLSNVLLGFPPGCARLVYVTLYKESRQVLPARSDMSYAYDDYVFDRSVTIPLVQPPYEIEVVAWSPEAVYDHTLTMAFTVQGPGEGAAGGLLSTILGL